MGMEFFDPNKTFKDTPEITYLGGSREKNEFESTPYKRISEEALKILKMKNNLSPSDSQYLSYQKVVENAEFKKLRENDFKRWIDLADNSLTDEQREREWAKLMADEIEIESQKN